MPLFVDILSEEFLRQEYIEKNKSQQTIANEVGCSQHTVSRAIRRYNLPAKPRWSGPIRNLAGHQAGYLRVVELHSTNPKKAKTYWRCVCECGKEVIRERRELIHSRRSNCGCKTGTFFRKGYGLLFRSFWAPIEQNAAKRGLAFEIDEEYAHNLFLAQGGRCALSGLVITIPATAKEFSSRRHTASLDRIDSGQGYLPGNVQWVHKHVNLMKQSLSEDDFIRFCVAIAKHRGGCECDT